MHRVVFASLLLGASVSSADPVLATAAPSGLEKLSLPGVVQGGKVGLVIPAPPVVQVYRGEGPLRAFGGISFNRNATEVGVSIPKGNSSQKVVMLAASGSGVQADGTWVLTADDTVVEGKKAQLETHPGNARVGFWTETSDAVTWQIRPGNYGMYYAELTYSQAARPATVDVQVGGNHLQAEIPSTGSWYDYRTVSLGRIYLEEKPQKVAVKGIKKAGGAVMNFKTLVLRPAPEGEQEVQATNEKGAFQLLASQATAYGIKLRYEPQPHKNCLGYWVHPTDYAEWFIKVEKAGRYQISLTQ